MTVLMVERPSTNAVQSSKERKRSIGLFSALVALSLAFDLSAYVAGLGHVYVHEVATLGVALLGARIAWRRRSLMPTQRAIVVLVGWLGLLAADTILLGAIHYWSVPPVMQKLFWLEHGDALRILVEIAVWVWVFGLIEANATERWTIVDLALWGGAVAVCLDAGYWLLANLAHLATTTFDLTVMFGLPLAALFVLRRLSSVRDRIRLAIFGAGGLLLYSRAALVVVIIAMAALLVSALSWRAARKVLIPTMAGWAIVLVLTLAAGSVSGLQAVSRLPGPPGVIGPTVAESSPLGTLLRLLSLGDQQIAGYTIPSRTAIWRDALSMAETSPIFGVGYHDYFAYSHVSEVKTGDNPDPGALFPSLIKAAHNDYLSMLAETGVIGLLIYLGFWGSLVFGSWMLWRRQQPDRVTAGLWLGFLTGFAAASLTGEFLIPRSPIWLAPAIVWWLLIAMVLDEIDRRYGWLAWIPR